MKKIKSFTVVLLGLCLAFAMCACGDAADAQPALVQGNGTQDVQKVYTVTVLDESGNPVVGALLQLCKDNCLPGPATDAEGKTRFSAAEDAYKVSFIMVPAGYDYRDDMTEFFFEDGATELTITLKTAE